MEQKVIILRSLVVNGKSAIAKSFCDFDKKIVWMKERDNSGTVIFTLSGWLEEGFSVVIEGIFENKRLLEEMLSLSAAKGVPCRVFEVDVPLEDSVRKDAVKIDTTNHSVEECRDIIVDCYKDWDKEKPFTEGAFVYLVKNNRILLSLTSYGPDVARYSGYGGGVDEDESVEEAVVREAWEEADIVVEKHDLKKAAIITRITKQIPENTQSIFKLTIFLTEKWEGEVKDLPGMKSEWFDFIDIPYDQMFPDNQIWMPKILDGKLVEIDSAFVRQGEDGKPELVNRDVREVHQFS